MENGYKPCHILICKLEVVKMSSLGKSINLYLMDGSASGRWQAMLSNWNGIAYKIPRGNLKDCGDLPELNTP